MFATDKVPYDTVVFCDLTRFRKIAYKEGGKVKYYIVDRTFPRKDKSSEAMMRFKETSKDKSIEDSECQETLAFMYQGESLLSNIPLHQHNVQPRSIITTFQSKRDPQGRPIPISRTKFASISALHSLTTLTRNPTTA